MTNPDFGILAGWGKKGPDESWAKVAAGYTDAEIQTIKNAGVTKENIQGWLKTYRDAEKVALDLGSAVDTPTARAILMEKILEKW